LSSIRTSTGEGGTKRVLHDDGRCECDKDAGVECKYITVTTQGKIDGGKFHALYHYAAVVCRLLCAIVNAARCARLLF
jgi:hypothetical protein